MTPTGNYMLSLGILFLQISALSCNHFNKEQFIRCPRPNICKQLGRDRCTDPYIGCGDCLQSFVEESDGSCRKIYNNDDILPDLPGDTIDNIANAEVPVNEPESCEEGYALSDGVCTDVDECRIANTCPADVGCTNTIGSYNCEFTGELFDSRNFGKEVNVAAQVDRRADGGDGGGGGDSGGGGGGGGGGGPPPPPVPGNVAPAPVNNHHQKTASGEIVLTNWQFIVIIASCVVVGVSGIAVAVLCWYKLHTTAKAASDTEYPAYGVTGPTTQRSSMTNGDRKLAQSAQMYHYQHQKQQMIALENRERGETQNDASDYDSDDNEEPTVYECPGLAPTGQMEVKNPLFQGMEERLQAEQKKDDN